MVGEQEDKSERIQIKVLKELDVLPGFHRRDSYSKRIQALLDCYNNNKGGFDKWQKKTNKMN